MVLGPNGSAEAARDGQRLTSNPRRVGGGEVDRGDKSRVGQHGVGVITGKLRWRLGLERSHVLPRRGAEHAPVLAAELRWALVADAEGGLRGFETLAQD